MNEKIRKFLRHFFLLVGVVFFVMAGYVIGDIETTTVLKFGAGIIVMGTGILIVYHLLKKSSK